MQYQGCAQGALEAQVKGTEPILKILEGYCAVSQKTECHVNQLELYL